MTASSRGTAARYARTVADRLGLRDWRFDVLDADAEPGTFATVRVFDEKRHADLRLCAEWDALPAAQRRESLVHEVLHCHLRGVAAVAREARTHLPPAAADIAEAVLRVEVELAVDALAHALAPLMPAYPA